MLEIILDTETTGLDVQAKHRIVEIGCIEINDKIPTQNIFHHYINPQRKISEEALKIHGYSEEFLSDKFFFSQVVDSFLFFIKDKKLVMHNAPFDLSFLNYELKLLKKNEIKKENVIDTLELARKKFPNSQNSLDALCKRFKIDNTKREKHSALLDCKLLLEVYINLIDQKEPKFDFDMQSLSGDKPISNIPTTNKYSKKIIKPTDEELKEHKIYIKSNFKKSFFKN